MSRTAVRIILEASTHELLEKILRKRSIPEFQKERVQIVLAAASGMQNKDIAPQYKLEVNRIGTWRNRWAEQHQLWQQSDGFFTGCDILFSSWWASATDSDKSKRRKPKK